MSSGPPVVEILLLGADGIPGISRRDAINLAGAAAFAAVGEPPEALVSDDNRDPLVVARNSSGDLKVLLRTTRFNATAKRDRVEAELRTMPFDEWCARYQLSPAWCRGEPIGVAFADEGEGSVRRTTAVVCVAGAAFVAWIWWKAVVPLGWVPAIVIGVVQLTIMAVADHWIVQATMSARRGRRV